MKYVLTILVLFAFFSSYAQNSNSSFGFTNIPVSVISAALGGSQVATFRGDVSQVSDNPAFIDSSLNQSVSLSYLNYLSDINQATVTYGNMFDSLGLGTAYLRYFDYGTFQETDEIGNEIGQFKVVDYEVGLTFSRFYKDNFSYGATLKQVFSSMYQYFAYGAAIDLGGYYHSNSGNFTAGIVMRNFGMELIDYTDGELNSFPMSMNLGVSNKFENAPIMFSFQYNNLQKWDLAENDADAISNTITDPLTGEVSRPTLTLDNFARHLSGAVSFVPSEKFNLMLGYNFRRRLELATNERPALVGFSFGANIKIKRFGIQYALTNYHLGGASNHFGVTTNLNEWYSRKSLN
ncbi:MAG: type IX secretion system protein PorQ [Salibacteraceae bacterium]